MNAGGLRLSSAPIVGSPAPGWPLVGTSDFDGDGTLDYVFQHRASGRLSVRYMMGTDRNNCSFAPGIATAYPVRYALGAW